MAFIGKTYNFVKEEKFKDFLESLKIPEERIQAILKSKPKQKLEKNGDEYSHVTIDENGTKTVTFKNGVEFEETLSEKYVSKTTFTVDGNVVTQVQNFSNDGLVITIKREYSDTGLVAHISTNVWDGPAVRYYDAV